jgi:S-adenosylmethionine:tRNA ribosyltransferase-isomerase
MTESTDLIRNQNGSDEIARPGIEEYEYDLPAELIADLPLPERDQSRLLVLKKGELSTEHAKFEHLRQWLRKGDVIVVNDTKVIPAKLIAKRKSGGSIRLLLIKPEASRPGVWQAMVSPIKRLRPPEKLSITTSGNQERLITIEEIITAEDGYKRVLVNLGQGKSVFELLNEIGTAPLPPYIHQKGERRQFDLDRYQTVFARAPGAVAAPTAGLHFSAKLMADIEAAGIKICRITLHVGPGTFKPIEGSVEEHFVEPEIYFIPDETVNTVNEAKNNGQRIIAVGTTSLRALETAGAAGQLRPVHGEFTSLYVRPGHEFKIVSGLVTNFHLSRSSLLILVATFAGRESIMHAYSEAIKERYRFYSYGDAMLIV